MRASAPTNAWAARSSCAAVGGSAAYGCGVPLAGKAERAEGGTSGTLVTEILGAPQRETVKEEQIKCVLAPRRGRNPRHGTAVSTSQKTQACPKARQNRSRHRYADPRARGGPLHRSAPNAFLFGPCTARFSFGTTKEKWGVHPRWTSPHGGSQPPVAAGRRPASPAQRPLTDPPATAAWTYTAARPGPGTAPRWGWCGAGSPPPPAPGW